MYVPAGIARDQGLHCYCGFQPKCRRIAWLAVWSAYQRGISIVACTQRSVEAEEEPGKTGRRRQLPTSRQRSCIDCAANIASISSQGHLRLISRLDLYFSRLRSDLVDPESCPAFSSSERPAVWGQSWRSSTHRGETGRSPEPPDQIVLKTSLRQSNG